MRIYTEAKVLASEAKQFFDYNISTYQATLLIDYMDMSGRDIGFESKVQYSIGVDVENLGFFPYSFDEIIGDILTMQNTYSQKAGKVNMCEYTLEDMNDELSYNNWRGGIYGSLKEREKIRMSLKELKLEEIELRKARNQNSKDII